MQLQCKLIYASAAHQHRISSSLAEKQVRKLANFRCYIYSCVFDLISGRLLGYLPSPFGARWWCLLYMSTRSLSFGSLCCLNSIAEHLWHSYSHYHYPPFICLTHIWTTNKVKGVGTRFPIFSILFCINKRKESEIVLSHRGFLGGWKCPEIKEEALTCRLATGKEIRK